MVNNTIENTIIPTLTMSKDASTIISLVISAVIGTAVICFFWIKLKSEIENIIENYQGTDFIRLLKKKLGERDKNWILWTNLSMIFLAISLIWIFFKLITYKTNLNYNFINSFIFLSVFIATTIFLLILSYTDLNKLKKYIPYRRIRDFVGVPQSLKNDLTNIQKIWSKIKGNRLKETILGAIIEKIGEE